MYASPSARPAWQGTLSLGGLQTRMKFTVRDFSEPDFDELVAVWHETNLLSYPYVRAHQEHTLADALRFFRSNVLAECHVWVAESSLHQYLGLLALSGSWIRQLAVFRSFQR
jgi:hypothetical protein